MGDVAIRVEGLSKQYRIGGKQERYKTIRDTLTESLSAPFRGRKRSGSAEDNTFWALRDVSFEVKRGEVVGIIGRNGAGKSTLLKILSRITEPTRGTIDIYGRVGSLLEVGTGFHPELSGRENIFLNGAILGMTRREIEKKFDEIVAFAEVEKFIDTAVKHYSSGMYLRLAFAVAAHLEPEILVVDEVLAVGDAAFQKKCLGKMQDVAAQGRTVLIVSHNLSVIEGLCQQAILLTQGQLSAQGATKRVIAQYTMGGKTLSCSDLRNLPRINCGKKARFIGITLLNSEGIATEEFVAGESITLRLEVEAYSSIRSPWIGVRLMTIYGSVISHIGSREAGFDIPDFYGIHSIECTLSCPNLLEDHIVVFLRLANYSHEIIDEIETAITFAIRATDVFGHGTALNKNYGTVFLESTWNSHAFDGTTARGENFS
jgi:lipopolysaccharide transport system ATP-binding protein